MPHNPHQSISGEPLSAADRASIAERAIVRRHLRRLWGLPGTRLGVVSWPASPQDRIFIHWHYWWQAHLLDNLVDAQLRDPSGQRVKLINEFVRGHRWRNGRRWHNSYYDDMSWWALALQRASAFDPASQTAVAQLTQRIRDGLDDDLGVVPWRVGDNLFNAPANGPAAILFARCGLLNLSEQLVTWLRHHLLRPDIGLMADGARRHGKNLGIETTLFTYNQGVWLGAELELYLAGRGDLEHIADLVEAISQHLAPDHVLIGHGGGDRGLFTGILVRYLAQVATRLPGTDQTQRDIINQASALVSDAADAVWRTAQQAPQTHDAMSPVFSPDWTRPAVLPSRRNSGRPASHAPKGVVSASTIAERDLSVQLGAWMTLEAAATLPNQNGSGWTK